MKTKVQLVNSVETWDANRRYKINAIVTYLGSDWQNTTGINSEPGIGNDWIRVSGNSQTLQEVSNNGGFDNGSTVKKGTTDAGNGGAKGVALKCSLDYEFKWEAGRLYVMQQDGFTIRDTLYNFTNTPTVTDDNTKGFIVDSRWILDNGDVYVCTDDTTGAAVWELVNTGTIPTLQQVLDNGGNEAPYSYAKVNRIGLYAQADADYGYVYHDDGSWGFIGATYQELDFGFGLGKIYIKSSRYQYPTAHLATLSFDSITANRNYEYQDKNGTVAFTSDIPTGVNNSTSVVLTSSNLNSTYPTAITGFKVYCTDIIAGKMVYEKTPSGWIGYACIVP
jgi:hypothetical protein